MKAKMGFNWENSDFVQVVAQSANWLRRAMCFSDDGCEVKKWVDSRLLEELWCPLSRAGTSRHLCKDVVRSDLAKLVTPDGLWRKTCTWHYDPKRCPQCHAKGLLARVLLGPMDWFFNCEKTRDNESPLLWVVAKLYDQLGSVNFYRTLSGMERVDSEYRIGQFLFRLPEADYGWFKSQVVDFSTLLRDAEGKMEVDYCLVLDKYLWQSECRGGESLLGQFNAYDVSHIMQILAEEKNILCVREVVARCSRHNIAKNWTVSDEMSCSLLSSTTLRYRQDALLLQQAGYSGIPQHIDMNGQDDPSADISVSIVREAVQDVKTAFIKCFYVIPSTTSGPVAPLSSRLKRALNKLVKTVEKGAKVTFPLRRDEVFLRKLANYFIWLRAVHPDLNSYTVRYAANYRLMVVGETGKDGASERIQNPCFVIASKALPSRHLLAAARVSLTHCMGPLEDYYAAQKATSAGQRSEFTRWNNVMGHELTKVYSALEELLQKSVFSKLTDQQKALVLDFARDTFAVGDMWTVTGKNRSALDPAKFSCVTLRKSLLRCCALACKFDLITHNTSGLQEMSEEDVVDLQRNISAIERNLIVSIKSGALAEKWLAKARKSWEQKSSEWFFVIVLAIVGNAFKHAYPGSKIRVDVSFRIMRDPVMFLRVRNIHHDSDCIKRFRTKFPAGLVSPERGTFSVVDQCGQAFHSSVRMGEEYRLAKFCSVCIDEHSTSVTLAFPCGGSMSVTDSAVPSAIVGRSRHEMANR